MPYSTIIATGSYVPKGILTNMDLEKLMKIIHPNNPERWTSDEWIKPRTGIDERRVTSPGETNETMAVESTFKALESALLINGFEAKDIDMIIHGTNTSRDAWPASAGVVQNKLQAMLEDKTRTSFVDVQAGCSGFGYALEFADSQIRAGKCRAVIATGVDALTFLTDYSNRETCPLFGDASGTFILGRSEEPGIIKSCLKGDGSYKENLRLKERIVAKWISLEDLELYEKAIPYEDALKILDSKEQDINKLLGIPKEELKEIAEKYGGKVPLLEKRKFMVMEGKKVFEFATKTMTEILLELVDLDCDGNIDKMRSVYESLKFILPHQANYRITEGTSRNFARKMGLNAQEVLDKMISTIHKYENTSAASTPVAFDEYVREGKIKDGDLIAMVYVGAGMTAAGDLIRYHAVNHYERETGLFSFRKSA